MQDLIAWKTSSDRMPLIIDGARQTGKTWLMKEFGRRHFKNCAYINLENNAVMKQVFENYTDTPQVIRALAAYSHEEIVAGETLVVLDEVQDIPAALSSLKYFYENSPEYHVVAAGSLLGIKFPKTPAPYPVGKINKLRLYPLSFTEFLSAVGEEQLVASLAAGEFALLDAFSSRLKRLLSDYYFIGGMPQVVSTFLKTSDYHRAREVQLQIIDDFENDIAKHLSDAQASHAHTLWQAVPIQLGKEQGKRFVFSELKEGGRARDFKNALQWLLDAKLLTKVRRISKPGIPLKSYASDQLFELFLLDVGLYGAMTELDIESVLAMSPLFEDAKGPLSEQFVCQQLIAELGVTPYYWASENSSGQLDFVVSDKGAIYPIEVKAAENLKSKSLRAFSERYDLHGFRFSLAGLKDQEWMTNIPLYAVSQLFSLH